MLISVVYTGRNIYQCEGITLFHGQNWVDVTLIKKALKNEFFRYRSDTGIIKIDGVNDLLQKIDLPSQEVDPKIVQKKLEGVKKIHAIETVKEKKKKEKDSKVKEALEMREEFLKRRDEHEKIKRSPLKNSTMQEPTKENNFKAQVGVL
jgi:hypothetical protein